MCGIAGIAKLGSENGENQALNRMSEVLGHRGPDAHDTWSETGEKGNSVFLAHRRLSILDLSEKGKQPMHSSCGRFVVILNGEIYNYRELRAELSEFEFRSGTDTEVLLNAWKKWGEACLDRLEGMFAFAMWDREVEKLTLVRDRLGIKPLYYRLQGKELLFASEVRGLLASGRFQARLERKALRDYLAYQTVHAPMTILQGVFLLEPGHLSVWQNGEWEKKAWWQITKAADKESGKLDYESQKKRIRELLERAVEQRMVADVPLGAFCPAG